MSDERKRQDGGQVGDAPVPAYGRVGPADPTADPATRPGMRVPRAEQATVAVPAGGAATAEDGQPAGDDTPTVARPVPATPQRTRVSGLWAGLILSAVVGIFLLVFILQNTGPVRITFLWLEGSLPTGVALLFAAIAGILLVAIPGTGRILQLRRAAKRGG